jgi:hypothetical protein
LASVALLACAACKKPAPQQRAEVVAAPVVSGVAAFLPRRTGVTEAAGVRVQSGVLGQAAHWGFSDLGLDSARIKLRIQLAKGGAQLAELLAPGALAAVNGGYFEPDFRPSTWVVDSGIQLSPKSDTSKGGVLALGKRGVYLGPFAGLEPEPELAVQSFPLLVEAEGKAGVYRDDGRRAARTVACLVDATLHFIVISAPRGDGPTLFETAQLLRTPLPAGFGCRRALNLDGGPSSGVWFAPELPARQRPPFAKVGYAILLMPR